MTNGEHVRLLAIRHPSLRPAPALDPARDGLTVPCSFSSSTRKFVLTKQLPLAFLSLPNGGGPRPRLRIERKAIR